ncbi:hypothetical protein SELMODRAFT_135749 [Selaginella moellendorffii]|uniref:Pentacotripeptide-repeat region of PRORP domain-containing protein n=1 Tax=Selaginella moellendorffii TaxID=88036 RepID=D8TAR3_SELML|nr:hypothetical protein SELMODRAFT_135749 [Selaginella moellendorffii]
MYGRHGSPADARDVFDKLGASTTIFSWNLLITAFVSSGKTQDAAAAFSRMPQHDVVSWNAVLSAYTRSGRTPMARQLFDSMPQRSGIKCDEITMLGVLSACNHLGLIQEGVSYFVMMVAELGIDPFVEHFSSLVDLLARVGQLREAHDLLRNMPFVPDPAACCSMLGACRTHGDVELGAYTAANEEFGIEPHHPSPYLFLSSMKH